MTYAEALGEITKDYYTIAISGSHGKSTTTALISLILVKAGFDPTVIIGTKLKEFGNMNFRLGKSPYLVIEADEWNRSFHNYYPDIIVLTNIDKEHLDTYGMYAGVVKGFAEYLENLKVGGFIVGNGRDKNIVKIVKQSRGKVILYNREKIARHNLWLSGEHNQWNAEAAWQAAKILGVKKFFAEKVFKNYHGAWRRFEELNVKSKMLKGKIYTDYAHHPTEIKATLQALREKYPKKKIICVFQPHQQDRLHRLFKEFTTAFDAADTTLILPVYLVEGREYQSGKTARDLVRAIGSERVKFLKDFPVAMRNLQSRKAFSSSVVVFMGAGSIDREARKYLLTLGRG
jgi:UDP-N-acetylmuramate--alanine ligase